MGREGLSRFEPYRSHRGLLLGSFGRVHEDLQGVHATDAGSDGFNWMLTGL